MASEIRRGGGPHESRRSERLGRDVQEEDHDVFRSGMTGIPKRAGIASRQPAHRQGGPARRRRRIAA
eukprot:14862964-Heterocapsa_arctica.AAC.1